MNGPIKELIKNTQSSVKFLNSAALAIPKDKRSWSPGGLARTTTDIILECASFPGWITATLQGKMPSPEEGKASKEKMAKELQTLESQLEFLGTETGKFCQFIENFPEARLTEEMTFPWGTYNILGVMGFHYWNNTYHLGQINYMQLILGDGEMHM